MINSGDTAWVLISAALVLLMTPGVAFFYGGMVRRKNILSILMQCSIIMCVLSIQWVLFGYRLAFSPSNGFWGGFGWIGLNGVGQTLSRLRRNHPTPGLYDFSGNVCGYHSRSDYRRFCRKDEIPCLYHLYSNLGHFCL